MLTGSANICMPRVVNWCGSVLSKKTSGFEACGFFGAKRLSWNLNQAREIVSLLMVSFTKAALFAPERTRGCFKHLYVLLPPSRVSRFTPLMVSSSARRFVLDGPEKLILDIFVQHDVSVSVDDTEVHPGRVQIDAAIKLMCLKVKVHQFISHESRVETVKDTTASTVSWCLR